MEEGLEGIKLQLQLLYVHNSNIVDTNDNARGSRYCALG